MQPVDAKELAVVAVVGFALAKLAERVPILYSQPVIVPTVLYTVAALDLFAAFLAIVALRPMLKAHVEASSANPAGKHGRFGLSE